MKCNINQFIYENNVLFFRGKTEMFKYINYILLKSSVIFRYNKL